MALVSILGPQFETLQVKLSEVEIHLERGGSGPPLLLLHGYPQTHAMWHRVAGPISEHFEVICPDLRGYGASSKPPGLPDHANYSKRAMAKDLVEVLRHLGHAQVLVAGHDRGARVGHRLALDHPEVVSRLCVMDIAPTLHMFRNTNQAFATGYYHWFFLIQPDGLPERLIGQDPEYYLREALRRWSGPQASFDESVVQQYVQAFTPEGIHATCEDYRAAASIDLIHDEADRSRKLTCPLHVLWGSRGFVHRNYDVLSVWSDYAETVSGRPLDCGHFLPEEAPEAVVQELLGFSVS